MDVAAASHHVLWAGFALAFVFGAVAQRTHFCTLGAIADIVNMGDWNRMRMWALAVGCAVLGSQSLHAAGVIDLGQSIYHGSQLNWLSHLLGGACFGCGMVLASGCGGKTLTRLGGGSLKALVVCLVMGLSAYMTLRGILAPLRVNVLDAVHVQLPGGQGISNLLQLAGLPAAAAFWLPVTTIGGGLLLWSLRAADFRTPEQLLGGLGIGLCVVGGWYASGHLGYLAEHPETLSPAFLATNSGRMESFSFIAPQAYTLELLLLWTDSSRHLSFAIALLLGTIAGGSAVSILQRRFRWEGFASLDDTASHLLGALLMGFGGVVALGCSIGQGITGLSTLALGAVLTLAALIGGAVLTLKFQYWRLLRG